MDQHETENNLHIPVDTSPKLNIYKTSYNVILTCYAPSFRVLCSLGCKNISKPVNGQNEHFRFKPPRKNKSIDADLFLSILNINKLYTNET